MFVSHPILHLQLYLFHLAKKSFHKLKWSVKAKLFYNSFSVCWDPLCQLKTLQIPVTAPYETDHFDVTCLEVQDLFK